MEVQIDARTVFKALLCVVIALLTAHLLGVLSTFYFGHDYVKGLVPMFNMDLEGNVPAWFSVGLLLFSSLLLALIARAHYLRQQAWQLWALLSVVFAFLSLDELAVLHERLGYNVGDAVGAEGTVHEYFWVVPYGIIVLVMGALYLRFLLRLAPRPRNLIVLGGALYVLGAIGIELAGSGLWADDATNLGWEYYSLVAVEETFEMLGVCIFIYALMLHCSMQQFTFAVRD